jgi:ribonuclease Z
MTASVRILSTSSLDSTPTIVLVAPDGSKVLINCGEGCQRIFLEQSQKLASVTTVCLCHLGHEAIGGLPGMILTSADVTATAVAAAAANKTKIANSKRANPHPSEVLENILARNDHSNLQDTTTPVMAMSSNDHSTPSLNLVGPVGIKHFMHSLRHFMRRDQFKVDIHEGSMNSTDSFSIHNNHPKHIKKRKINETRQEQSQFFSIQSFAFDTTSSEQVTGSTQKGQYAQHVLSYIISTPPTEGKFLVEKAIELGIPKGPLYAQLKSGKSISFKNSEGTDVNVTSDQVVTPTSPASSVMILYIPTKVVADQIFVSKKQEILDCLKKVNLELVIYITTNDLFQKYASSIYWKSVDGEDAVEQHVFLTTNRVSGDMDGTPFQSAAEGALARSYLDSDIYLAPMSSATGKQIPGNFFRNCHIGRNMMEYTLLPRSKKGFVRSFEETYSDVSGRIRRNLDECGALKVARELREQSVRDMGLVDVGNNTALIFTGTGSAIPCKHRNVTGMLLRQRDGRSILLDVGEGSIGQLLRMQQSTKNSEEESIVNKITAVWISHPHADHHLGILRLLGDRTTVEPLLLIAPTPIHNFLDEYSAIDPSICRKVEPIDCKYLVKSNPEIYKQLYARTGIQSITAVPVQHCAHAYACILDGTDFGKVVYSGDCRPSQQLAMAGFGADILIHEATFEDGMEADAVIKKHSTIGEALGIASKMETKAIVLTHFSQRYPRLQPLAADRVYSFHIVFAFDYMHLRPSTIQLASRMTSSLRLLYADIGESEVDPDSGVINELLSVPGLFSNSQLL